MTPLHDTRLHDAPGPLRQYAALVEQTRLDPEATRRIITGARQRGVRRQQRQRATAAVILLCIALGWGLYQDQHPRETPVAASSRLAAHGAPPVKAPQATIEEPKVKPSVAARNNDTLATARIKGAGDLRQPRAKEKIPRPMEHALRPRASEDDPQREQPGPRLWRAQDREATFLLGAHRLTLTPRSQVRMLSVSVAGTVLRVERGSADFSIKPLAGKRFSVRTAQLEVAVVGTRFTVAVDSSCSRVSVDHGQVQVTSNQGATWSLAAGSSRTLCSEPTRPEVLTPQEQLIHRALTLLASGAELSQAEHLLRRYLTEYPAGSFIQEANYQLMFALARQGQKKEAHEQARRFLRRFPGGELAKKVRQFINP